MQPMPNPSFETMNQWITDKSALTDAERYAVDRSNAQMRIQLNQAEIARDDLSQAMIDFLQTEVDELKTKFDL